MTVTTVTTLTCDRETRPPVDGLRTVCGRPYAYQGPAGDALRSARNAGWTHTGAGGVYCPEHPIGTANRPPVCGYCGHEAGMHTGGACRYDGVHSLDGSWRHCTCTRWTEETR